MNPSKEDNVDESDTVVVKEEPKKQRKSLHVQIREKSWFGKKCLKIFKLFTNTFVMTFLAEWGDRSQLATIVMAGSLIQPFLMSNVYFQASTTYRECVWAACWATPSARAWP